MTSRTQVLLVRLSRGARAALICWGLGLCLAVCIPSTRSACAQAPANDAQQYKQLIEQALSEFRHKNWPEARVLFRRAHELSPSARTLRGMGVVSYEMRDYVQAVRDLDAALTDTRQPLNPEQRSEAETLLSRARTFVGVYTVVLEPATAVLFLDGRQAQLEADGTLLLPFGEHTLSARAEGYETASTQLKVQGGERGEVKLALVAVPAARAESPALSREQPTPADVDSERDLPVAREPMAESEGGLRYTWIALGASAAFGGATAAFWFVGDSKLDKLAARCDDSAQEGSPCRKGETDTAEIERFELLTNISLGLTGAALVATGVLAFIEWPRSRESPVTVALGPSSLFVRGAF